MEPKGSNMLTGVLYPDDDTNLLAPIEKPGQRKLQLSWRNIIFFAYLHLSALFGFSLIFTSAKMLTTIWAIFVVGFMGGIGVTAGAHRLWSHKSYKAKWPLRLFLTFCHTMAFQDAVIDWARDHRVHHKFNETDADPHNARRGFFFAHIGWLLCRKHPQVKEQGSKIDLSDLTSDPFLAFQKKYYLLIMPVLCFILPTVIPMYFWNELFYISFSLNLFRYALTLNAAWLVNSVAHCWGYKPYDKFMNPADNIYVSRLAMGEGWHNYHHTFPWDYRSSELGGNRPNLTATFIDLMAKIGLAYDLKTVSKDVIQKRVERTGDGTHELWGWGDKDQTVEERKEALVTHRLKLN